jgi:hypothetical protein
VVTDLFLKSNKFNLDKLMQYFHAEKNRKNPKIEVQARGILQRSCQFGYGAKKERKCCRNPKIVHLFRLRMR